MKSTIDRKILGIFGVFLALTLTLGLLLFYGNKTISGAEAYVRGNKIWTQAQKQAVIHLMKYIQETEERYYEKYLEHFGIIKGDQMARKALTSRPPNTKLAKKGFKKGNNQPSDIDDLIWISKTFRDSPYLKEAFKTWKDADQKMAKLHSLAEQVHRKVNSDALIPAEKQRYTRKIYSMNLELSTLETQFFRTVIEASNHIKSLVWWLIVGVGLTVISIGCYICIQILNDFKMLNRELSNSKSRFRNVLRQSPDIIYQQNVQTGEYDYISERVEDMLGYTQEEFMEKDPDEILELIHPDDRNRLEGYSEDLNRDTLQQEKELESEYRIQTKAGTYKWINNRRTLLRDEEGNPYAIVGNVRDITDRKKKEQKLDQSLEEKRILLSEIHHRVKNNLAVVSGILTLQQDVKDNEYVTEVLDDCKHRISSIAQVHELLYNTQNFSRIKLNDYLHRLFEHLLKSQSENKVIEYHLDIDSITIDISNAVHFGLLINELAMNSLKHAFKDRNRGSINLEVTENADHIHVHYADDGVGLPSNHFQNDTPESKLGMLLIKALLRQLDADYELETESKGFGLNLTMKHFNNDK